VLARIAVINHGYKGTEVAKALSLSPPSVSRLVENGENILDNQKHISVKMTDMELCNNVPISHGCATSGSPDKNDWIRDCESQDQIYPIVMEAIGYLEQM
jgi:hypothetical protein